MGETACTLELVEELRREAHHASAALRVWLRLADRLGRNRDELRILCRIRVLGPPEPLAVHLVPDFEVVHTPLVVLGERTAVVLPRLFALGPVVYRHEADRRLAEGVCHVELVAEADVEPHLDSAFFEVADYAVEPGPVVDAFLLFAFPPAGLDSGVLHADRGDAVVAGLGVEEVAVETFKANRDAAIFYFRGGYVAELAEELNIEEVSIADHCVVFVVFAARQDVVGRGASDKDCVVLEDVQHLGIEDVAFLVGDVPDRVPLVRALKIVEVCLGVELAIDHRASELYWRYNRNDRVVPAVGEEDWRRVGREVRFWKRLGVYRPAREERLIACGVVF